MLTQSERWKSGYSRGRRYDIVDGTIAMSLGTGGEVPAHPTRTKATAYFV
jgi:hypothetical protein